MDTAVWGRAQEVVNLVVRIIIVVLIIAALAKFIWGVELFGFPF